MGEDKMKASVRATFTEYLQSRGLRKTPERYAILDKVCSMTEHFHVDALYSALETDAYHVSLATVYNTMDLLVDSGIVRRHQFNNQPVQYERIQGTGNHHHLICTQCGKIKDVKDTELMKTINTRRYPAFHTSYFSINVYGVCSRCMRRGKTKKET